MCGKEEKEKVSYFFGLEVWVRDLRLASEAEADEISLELYKNF